MFLMYHTACQAALTVMCVAGCALLYTLGRVSKQRSSVSLSKRYALPLNLPTVLRDFNIIDIVNVLSLMLLVFLTLLMLLTSLKFSIFLIFLMLQNVLCFDNVNYPYSIL